MAVKLKHAPTFLRVGARRVQAGLTAGRLWFARVRTRSEVENAYHCCVHKTASQWFRNIFSDLEIYRCSGLRPYHYQTWLPGGFDDRKLQDRRFVESFPPRTVVSPIYVDFENFRNLPKPENFRAFFVARDPRDVLVSSYFSALYSHRVMGSVATVRDSLRERSVEWGLLHMIEVLEDFGVFAALQSWAVAPADSRIRVFRFEDLTGNGRREAFRELFEHLDVRLSDQALDRLLSKYSFRRLSSRERGSEDRSSHYRKGVAGDWKNHFTGRVTSQLDRVAGDAIARLGYESR